MKKIIIASSILFAIPLAAADLEKNAPEAQEQISPEIEAYQKNVTQELQKLTEALDNKEDVDLDCLIPAAHPKQMPAWMVAAAFAETDLALQLINKGANVNVTSKNFFIDTENPERNLGKDMPAVMVATSLNSPEVLKAVISKGADPKAEFQSRFGKQNAGTVACVNGTPEIQQIIATVLTAPVDIPTRCSLEDMQLATELGINFNAPSEHGVTALHIATRWMMEDKVRFLLEAGADMHARDAGSVIYITDEQEKAAALQDKDKWDGQTPYEIAQQRGGQLLDLFNEFNEQTE